MRRMIAVGRWSNPDDHLASLGPTMTEAIAQVRGTYGDPEAQTTVETRGNTLILCCSASERGGTAEFASRLIGKREVVRRQRSRSDPGFLSKAHSTRTITEHQVTEDAVEELSDLSGYLKLASQPEWRKF